METNSDRKIDITKKIPEVEDNSVLDRIEDILTNTEIVAYTTSGEPLNRDEYKKRIENISNDVHSGEKGYTSGEVQDYVKNRKL